MTLRTLLLVVALLLATAAPASAHVRLLASDPEPGQALDKPPPSVRLTFDEPLKAPPTITVTDPNGTEWSMGKPTMDDKVVTVPADAAYGPKGRYTVNYRVTGQDGHLVTGEVPFDITASFGQPPATQQEQSSTPTARQPARPQQEHDHSAQSASDNETFPPWLWIVVAAILVGIVVLAVGIGRLVRRRR
nr:copper resistance CopC family protein [Kibdelosporangium sp. MJ126-NF4]CEL21463.1 Copper resistance protein CopC [Kibdelosporangium sp. MJ126-NF4]CTQ95970.1 Copper resistance protein CopC [Kibdelosporangium sp. MJ126-NF4]